MIKSLKKKMKEQKGFTLIELLAVIVILGILAAIAVPSIMGIIDNTKKDAHAANARQMISSAKLAITDNKALAPTIGSIYINAKYLEDNGYIDTLKDPDGGASYLELTAGTGAYTGPLDDSYVVVTKTGNQFTYSVRLYSTTGVRGIQVTAAGKSPVADGNISRSDVH